MDEQTPELLAPAGGWDCLRAAVANGADAVYFGLPRFNARLRADNFRDDELAEVVRFCHRHGVKAYVAFNTLVFTGELDAAERMLRDCSRAGVDALIVQDVGLVRLARAIVPDLPIHASTQMTVTSPEGVEFARELGIERVVLARELSLRELEKFGVHAASATADPESSAPGRDKGRKPALPLEVFVHGALCVAYSGQCLTSESLGQRSANRGECAQACRMPYELIVDGALHELGDKRYLLSPQDLAAAEEIPALLERGVTSFKIEGRLKSPEYVAAVCQVYRRALDAALAGREHPTSNVERPTSSGAGERREEPVKNEAQTANSSAKAGISEADRYQLEMTFSRGLFTGWMHGVDHQRLVSARFGKKRGPLAGRIARVGRDHVEFEPALALKPGDGVVFDTGGDTNAEQGGRIYEVRGWRFYFEHGKIDFAALRPGDRVWKTDDPALNRRLQQSFAGRIEPRRRIGVDLVVRGKAGEAMEIEAWWSPPRKEPPSVSTGRTTARSAILLQAARTAPLTTEKLREHLGRFGEHAYELCTLRNELEGEVLLPIGEMNRLRRQLAGQLDLLRDDPRREAETSWREVYRPGSGRDGRREIPRGPSESEPVLTVLCRTTEHIGSALAAGVAIVYADFEDIRRYQDAVEQVRAAGRETAIFLATPRIQKAGEQGFFKLIEGAAPDGVLIRNLGAIDYFREHASLRRIGDFSLNVANPLTAQHFIGKGWNASRSATISISSRCSNCSAPRRRNGLNSRCTSTCRCFTWSTACLRRSCRRARRFWIAGVRAKNTGASARLGWASSIRFARMWDAATRCSTPCRRPVRDFFRNCARPDCSIIASNFSRKTPPNRPASSARINRCCEGREKVKSCGAS
jgi:putative protease